MQNTLFNWLIFRKKSTFLLPLVILVFLIFNCGSSPSCPEGTTQKRAVIDTDKRHPAASKEVDSSLVGLWRGYWSLKGGEVNTDKILFLADGRWGWIALHKNEIGPIQRSGKWSVQGETVLLAETQRVEVVGCDETDTTDKSCQDKGKCQCRKPKYRVIQRDEPFIERLPMGECPLNNEAERLDRNYNCRSFSGRAFWRRSVPKDSEQVRFFITM